MSTKILVTGGAGFIGANFVQFWAEEHPGDKIVVVDALTYAGNRSNLEGVKHEFVHADIGDLDAMESALRDHKIDVIVNFAAESHNSYAITNPGAFGALLATPIINQPQVAILDLEAVTKRAVVVNGDSIAIRPMTYLCMSWDHRALDGALAAQFLSAVRRHIEGWDG